MKYWKMIDPTTPRSPSGFTRSIMNLNINRLPIYNEPLQMELRLESALTCASLDGAVLPPRLNEERELYYGDNLHYLREYGMPTGDCATCALHQVLELEGLRVSYGLLAESIIVDKRFSDIEKESEWFGHHCSATHRNLMNVLNCYSNDKWKTAEFNTSADAPSVATWSPHLSNVDYAVIRIKGHVFPVIKGQSPEVARFNAEPVQSIVVPERFCNGVKKAFKKLNDCRKAGLLQGAWL